MRQVAMQRGMDLFMSHDGPFTIAYADHAAEVGGAEISLRLLLERLDRTSFRPLILHAPGAEWLNGAPGEHELTACEVFTDERLLSLRRGDVSGSLLGNVGKLARAASLVLRIRGALRSNDVDLVHTNTLKCHLLAGAAAWSYGSPLIWHLRDLVPEEEPRAILWRAARLMRPTVIAISEAVAHQARGLGVRVEVVYNGIPLAHFCPGPEPEGLRRELGLKLSHRIIMIVARLTPWKGHCELIRALPAVLRRFPEARLVIVGTTGFWDESYVQELQSMAQTEGVAEAVLWTGHREDVPALLRLCEVFVLPSRDEPFGRALVEAMATEKPVVAGRGGASPEVCPDGTCGYLVDPADPAEIANAIIDLLSNPGRAREMGRAGRKRAVCFFDADSNAERVQALYRELLAHRR